MQKEVYIFLFVLFQHNYKFTKHENIKTFQILMSFDKCMSQLHLSGVFRKDGENAHPYHT